MLTTETIAELRTMPRSDFIARVREIVGEDMADGLKPAGAIAEIRAALRELDRAANTERSYGRRP